MRCPHGTSEHQSRADSLQSVTTTDAPKARGESLFAVSRNDAPISSKPDRPANVVNLSRTHQLTSNISAEFEALRKRSKLASTRSLGQRDGFAMPTRGLIGSRRDGMIEFKRGDVLVRRNPQFQTVFGRAEVGRGIAQVSDGRLAAKARQERQSSIRTPADAP